jgi:hypothetical protein
MKAMKLFLMLLLATCVASGCSDTGSDASDRLFADMSANLREMSAILTSVTDEASAHAAVPRIEAVREKMRDCARRARELPRPDPATEQRQNEAMQALMAEVMPQIASAQARLAERPELLAILAPAMAGMENDL